jgi:predicted dehydrogenase
MERRTFLLSSAGVLAAGAPAGGEDKPVRVGVVGVGERGAGLTRILLGLGARIPALCDIDAQKVAKAQDLVQTAGQPKPEGYSRGEEDYRRLMERDDLDGLIIATPWEWHAPMAVYGMKSGKYTAVEVPCALTIQECWDLVNTHEQTRVPFMMLENTSFDRHGLAVLNMIRAGLLGEIMHSHCAHDHNVMYWYLDDKGYPRWSGNWLLKRNADQYPTHSLGPVMQWMNITRGDNFVYLTSTATRQRGISEQISRKYGKDHPAVQYKWLQGDVVTTVVKTSMDSVIVISMDMQLPRPKDDRWLVQGTKGVYSLERNAIFLLDKTKGERWDSFDPYLQEWEHTWYKTLPKEGLQQIGHPGIDFLEMREFVKAIRESRPLPLDVYDSVVMSSVVPLSEESIRNGSAPVQVPDFTRGKWKTRKPTFAIPG